MGNPINNIDNYPTLMSPTLDNCFITSTYDMQNSTAYLMKIKADGTVDNSFAGGLFEYTFPNGFYGSFYKIIQLQDSSYLAAGNYGNSTTDFISLVIKLDKNGIQDLSYNVDGKVTFNPTLSYSFAAYSRVLINDTDNSYLIAGNINTGLGTDELFVTKFTSSGNLDNSFATNGSYQSTTINSLLFVEGIFRVDPQHYLVIAYLNSALNKVLFFRFNNDGTLDSNYGINGFKELVGYNNFSPNGIIHNNQDIYLYGAQNNFSIPFAKAAIVKTNFNAQPDLSFGTNGIDSNIVNPNFQSTINGLQIDASNNYCISGSIFLDTPKFFLVKKDANLGYVSSFGNNGFTTVCNDNSTGDFANFSCLLSDDSWIIGGGTGINDGDMTFCKVASTIPLSTENVIKNSLSFYPNPAHNMLNFKNNSSDNTINIYSIDGSLKQSNTIKKNTQGQIDISSLASGLYFINYKENNRNYTQKLIVE